MLESNDRYNDTPVAGSLALHPDRDWRHWQTVVNASELDSFTAWLSRLVDEEDAEEWAERLLLEYGSLADVAGAGCVDLLRQGVPAPIVADLAASLALWQSLQRSKLQGRAPLKQWSQASEFIRLTMRSLPVKHFRVLFLDSQACLLRDETMFRGIAEHVQAYPREVVQRCFELEASSVITIRNMPGRETSLTLLEIKQDQAIARALAAVDITVRGRVLVSGDDVVLLNRQHTAVDPARVAIGQV